VAVYRSVRAKVDTKTRKSRRLLKLPRKAVAALKEHHKTAGCRTAPGRRTMARPRPGLLPGWGRRGHHESSGTRSCPILLVVWRAGRRTDTPEAPGLRAASRGSKCVGWQPCPGARTVPLTARLAARGLTGSSTRHERGRRAGLLPGKKRRGAGRGHGSVSCSTPRPWRSPRASTAASRPVPGAVTVIRDGPSGCPGLKSFTRHAARFRWCLRSLSAIIQEEEPST
jgi:hypothetical protein